MTESALRLAPVAIVQSEHREFLELERRVDEAEGEGLRARWEFGHKLLRDKMNVDQLARSLGKPEKASEFHHRKRFARKYPTDVDFLYAVQEYGSWSQILKTALVSGTIARNAAGAHEGIAVSDSDADGVRWKLLLGDFRDRLADLPDGSVDLVVTDPPYPQEYLPLWSDLGLLSERVLTPGGVLVARCGHLFLPQVLGRLGEFLQYGWTYAEPLPGANVRFQGRKIAVAYQPWVAFSNGPWPSGRTDWHPDMLTESPRLKARYVWEQKPTVAAELIATHAAAGADVLDPFAGSGAFGEAAVGVGCRWIGVELDPAGHAEAVARLRSLDDRR